MIYLTVVIFVINFVSAISASCLTLKLQKWFVEMKIIRLSKLSGGWGIIIIDSQLLTTAIVNPRT